MDLLALFITALAIAWASVWLLAPWLSAGGRIGSSLLALAVMLAVGAGAHLGHFGTGYSGDAPLTFAVFWSVCAVSLLGAMTLSGYCCRKAYRPEYFGLWLLLWMPLASAVCMSVVAIFMVALMPGLRNTPLSLVFVFIQMLVFSLMMTGMLYVFNLPVLILAHASPCYRDRFRKMYRLPGPD